jgi:cellulose biosynthesis protein BcsQ
MNTDIALVRMKELSEVSGVQLPNLTRYFKSRPEDEVFKSQSKITGVLPSGAEAFLKSKGFSNIYRPGVYLTNSQTGGVAKTTATINLAMAYARISDRKKHPILIVDVDSQASLTGQLLGDIDEDAPVLADFVLGKVKSITDIAISIGENIFLIPSSLENSYLDKAVRDPVKIKSEGLKVLQTAFKTFSNDGNLKIFMDTPPALSPLTHTFLLAANQLGDEFDRVLCIPIRPDKTAIKGCQICLEEYQNIVDAFGMEEKLSIFPFMTHFEQRTKNSMVAMKMILDNKVISEYGLCPLVIRESAEIAKSINKSKHIYSKEGFKLLPISQEYTELMLHVMGGKNEA